MLAEANAMLDAAKSLNESGQHGAAMEKAYYASGYVAAAYLLAVNGQCMPPNDSAYDLFAKTIREPNRHPHGLQKIKETVGKVSALREVYEPALLGETASEDARQMLDCVAAMEKLVQEITVKPIICS